MFKFVVFFICVCLFNLSYLHSIQERHSLWQVGITNNDNDLLEILQKYGNNPEKPALNNALEENDVNSALILLEYGVDVNRRGSKSSVTLYGIKASSTLHNDGQTALEIAIEKNMFSMIPVLLEKGANPYSMRKLQYRQINNGNQVYVNDYKDTTAISIAISKNQLDIIILLNDLGVSMDNICCYIGYNQIPYTPLQYALSNNYDIANYLISIRARLEPK
jgi:hypothetical protein